MNDSKIKISYMNIEKIIEIPNDYDELLDSFIEEFREDENKDYEFFFKDNDNINNEDIKEKHFIKNDVCYSDFINKKQIFVQELKKEEEEDIETEIGSKNLADSIHSLNSNESLKTHNIYYNNEKELTKQAEDTTNNKMDKNIKSEDKSINNEKDKFNNINPFNINNINELNKLKEDILKKNKELSLINNKIKRENESLINKLKGKDIVIKEKEEQINQYKLNIEKKYESAISELKNKINDIKNSVSNEKEEQKMKNIEIKNKIDELKRKISEKKNKNNKLFFEKESLLITKNELEKQLFNEKIKLDNESKNENYDLILSINDSVFENELKFSAFKKENLENKRRKKILEIYTIFEQKLKIYENKKKKNDFDKIIKLEQIHKSKIIENSKIKYGKVVSKDEGLDINKIIEDNNNLKEKIFEKKAQKIKKRENKIINSETKENENQKNEIIVLSDNQINDLKNKMEDLKDQSKKEKNDFCIINSSDDENGDRNDAPCVLALRINNNNKKIDYSTPGESICEPETYYSYSCINKKNLISCIEENTESAKIEIEIENNGTKDWPENNVKLVFAQKSKIKGENIILKSQKCKEKNKYEIQFHNLSRYKEGIYESYAYININGWCGEQIILKIIIRKKKIISEIEKHLKMIDEFRKEYSLEPNEYSNEKLFYVLKNTDYDREQAFADLFNENN